MNLRASAADDSLHPPGDTDLFWTETAWFGFSVPERRLAGAVYPVFRPNQGVCSSGVYVWDDGAENPHEILYARNCWHLPMPDDLTRMRLASGLEYDVVHPLHEYEIRYRDGAELELELRFTAVHDVHAPMLGARGHLDQAGRVQGILRLHGEDIEVDCIEMRDRSWSVRPDHGPVRAAYDYGFAGPGDGFLAMTMAAGDREVIVAGYRLVDGEMSQLTEGQRTVDRQAGRPVRVRVEATDEHGRALVADGTCVNRFAFQSSPNFFAWMSLAAWSIGGAQGWGQSQDVWSPAQLRAARRAATG